MRNATLFAALSVLTAGLAAQTNYVVSPRAYAAVEGDSNNTIPFWSSQYSYMQLHDDLQDQPRMFTEIAFRKDGGTGSPIAAYSLNLTLRFSNAATTSSTASTTFAVNHGANLLEVLTATNVNFPADPGISSPNPFNFIIPFPLKPFVFIPSGSLCWEVRIHSTTSTQSNPLDAAGHRFYGKTFGSGCISSTQAGGPKPAPAYISASGVGLQVPPDTWSLAVVANALEPNQPSVWMVGLDNKFWGVVPLPFDLTPLGGKGCSILVAPVLMIAGMADAAGKWDTSPAPRYLPRDPLFAGTPTYHQVFSADPGKPAFPFVFTNGASLAIPLHQSVCRIYASGTDSAVSGSIDVPFGLVTRFGKP